MATTLPEERRSAPPRLLWILVHLLAVLNLVSGYMLYVDPNYYTSRATAPIECGIITTSMTPDSSQLDPVTIFFFRGEGAVKLAISIYTLFVSKWIVRVDPKQAAELCGASFFAFLLPATFIWRLNLRQDLVDDGVFDARTYTQNIQMAMGFLLLLSVGLLQSYMMKSNVLVPKDSGKASRSPFDYIGFVLMVAGIVFGIQCFWDPEASFGPHALAPFFVATTTPNGSSFDAVMMYACRMFGATHMPHAVALWYALSSSIADHCILAYTLTLTIIVFFVPIDVLAALGRLPLVNQPLFVAFSLLHIGACYVMYKATVLISSSKTKSTKQKVG